MKRQILAVVFVLPVLAGCGPGEGKVTGVVTFEGKPLPAGRVSFRPADARANSISVELNENGAFEVVLPCGEAKVIVDNREWEPQPDFGPAPLPPGLSAEGKKALGSSKPARPEGSGKPRTSKLYVKIPERYHDLEQSGLKVTVTSGTKTQNFELTK